MGVRAMSTERLLGVTVRLLSAAAVLVVVGLILVTRSGWQQVGLSYGSDGPIDGEIPFTARVAIAVFESSFRPAALQLMVAAVLVAGAVVSLQFHPDRPRIGSLRWEVLGAGCVVLVTAVVFVSAHVFVVAAPESIDGEVSNYIGLQRMSEAAVTNLLPMTAALLALVVSALWWVRSGRATDVEEPEEDTAPDDPTPDDGESVDMSRGAHEPRDDARGAAAVDHSRDWSPEDFRPPR